MANVHNGGVLEVDDYSTEDNAAEAKNGIALDAA